MSLEKLDLSVALKLAFVEDSLAKVEEYRTQLHQNAQKVDTAMFVSGKVMSTPVTKKGEKTLSDIMWHSHLYIK